MCYLFVIGSIRDEEQDVIFEMNSFSKFANASFIAETTSSKYASIDIAIAIDDLCTIATTDDPDK